MSQPAQPQPELRFVVVKWIDGEWEPLHPGTINARDAGYLYADHALDAKPVERWTAEAWERYDAQVRAECFPEGQS